MINVLAALALATPPFSVIQDEYSTRISNLLESHWPGKRESGIDQARKSRNPVFLPKLAHIAMNDGVPGLRDDAADAIALINPRYFAPTVLSELSQFVAPWHRRRFALSMREGSTMDVLVSLAILSMDKDVSVLSAVVDSLCNFRGNEATALLQQLTKCRIIAISRFAQQSLRVRKRIFGNDKWQLSTQSTYTLVDLTAGGQGESLTNAEGEETLFDYDDGSRLTKMTRENGTYTSYGYDVRLVTGVWHVTVTTGGTAFILTLISPHLKQHQPRQS